MSIFSTTREASKDEMAREIDRCHAVIINCEARIARLKAVLREASVALEGFNLKPDAILSGDATSLTMRVPVTVIQACGSAANAAREALKEAGDA